MREPKILWLMLLLVGYDHVHAQAKFEDADKSNEYTNQNFDLRHTIPGEPGVDYPILSAVPKTSFICKGRHEGYYADVESRCQVFRICAHTARSPQGFGFLCPNGTLFNQQHFVCDWYRNVNCEESERYYDKNVASRVGSTHDMMETVRQMMEYPMKTISKALQKSIGSSRHPEDGGKKTAITREQVESAQSQAHLQTSVRGEAVKSEPIPKGGDSKADDIYVNSLGELSSDPGIKFDHTNAHIVAEYPREYHYNQQMNFAERVNAGLEEFEDLPQNTVMAPDYIKQIVSNSHDEAAQLDLASNINGLLEDDSTNLDTSVSGYQVVVPPVKVKQPFRFLSRGFSMQDEKQYSKDSAYQYIKPKQTESTIRFTPNDIPIETQKDTSSSSFYTQKHTLQQAGDKITPSDLPEREKEEEGILPEEPLQIILEEYLDEPVTHAIVPHHLSIDDETLAESVSNNSDSLTSFDQEALSKTTELPIDVDKVDVNLRAADLLLAGFQLTSHNEELQQHHSLNSNELSLGHENTVLSPVTSPPVTSTTELPIAVETTPMSTSTETRTEINSIQERIRSYRRFANQHRALASTTTTTTSTTSPIFARRANLRPLNKVSSSRASTSTTTTIATTTSKPTRNYQQRIAASRLRLSRLGATKNAAAISTSTAVSNSTEAASATTPLPLHDDQFGPNKKVSIRNIDRETGNTNSVIENGVATWESVHNNLQRFQVNRNRGTRPSTTTSTTTATPTSTSRSNLPRNRNRFSNFKTQVTRTRGTSPSAAPTTTTRASRTTASSSTTSTTPLPQTPLALSSTNSIQSPTLAQQLSSLTASLQDSLSYNPPSPTPTPPDTPTTLTHTTNTHNIVVDHPLTNSHYTQDQTLNTAKQATSSDGSAAASATFLSFDKLTRAIVDDSILQNYKSSNNNNQQQHHLQYQQQQQQHQFQATARSSNVYQSAQPQAQTILGGNGYTFGKQTTAATAATSIGQQQQHRIATHPIPQKPNIVIARAEGQRIQPTSVNNVIASLVAQPAQTKTSTSNSYVSLNDFLHNKFGNSNVAPAASTSSATFGNQQQQHHQHHHQLGFITQQYKQPILQQQQQPQKLYHHPQQHQQPHHVAYQQPQQQHFSQLQRQPAQSYQNVNTANEVNPFLQHTLKQQPQYQQHESLKQTAQSIQQPYLTPNIFANYQQHQQHLPQFPPLAQPPTQQLQHQQISSSSRSFGTVNGNHADYLNIQLPSLANGLIPSPTLQVAQKRSDDDISHFLLASSPTSSQLATAFYSGATSYDVPLNSIGRLPNDITERLRKRLRRH